MLGLQGPSLAVPSVPRTQTASTAGVKALSVFFQASCSWQSEGLFGQFFSIALPVRAVRGLLCLGSFSVVWHARHMEGPPWLESYSVVGEHPGWGPTLWFSVRCLMGQPLYCSAADAGVWGERGYSDVSTRYMRLNSITLLPWLPGFPPPAFPTTISSLTFPESVSPQSTAALALGLPHNP